jgi:hypothetical protein
MLLRPFVRNGRPGLIATMARTTVVVGTGAGSAGGVTRRQRAKAQQAAAGRSAAPADLIAQLKELAVLKEQGVLTEEEFTAQKARILGRDANEMPAPYDFTPDGLRSAVETLPRHRGGRRRPADRSGRRTWPCTRRVATMSPPRT